MIVVYFVIIVGFIIKNRFIFYIEIFRVLFGSFIVFFRKVIFIDVGLLMIFLGEVNLFFR